LNFLELYNKDFELHSYDRKSSSLTALPPNTKLEVLLKIISGHILS